MAKKGESKSVVKNESGKSIEEFLFAINLSTEIISKSVTESEYYSNQESKEELEKQLRSTVESFYRRNKNSLYPKTDSILNTSVQISESVITNKFRKGFHLDGVCYKPSMEVNKKDEMVDGDEEMDAKFDAAHAIFLEKKYGTSTPEYIIIKGSSSLFDLFRREEFIDDLYQNTKKNLKPLLGKENYLNNLQSIEKQLNELQSGMTDFNKRVPVEFKFWRELLLEKTKLLIKDLREDNSTPQSQRMRAFILKCLVEVSGLNPKTQKDLESFIADVLGSSPNAVGAYFNDFKKDNFGMKKTEAFVEQIKKALKTCEKLEDKEKGQNAVYSSLFQKVSDISKDGKEDLQ